MLANNIELLAPFKELSREIGGGVKVFADDGSTIIKTLLPNETLSSVDIESSAPNGKFFGFAIARKATVKLIEKLPLEKGVKIQPFILNRKTSESVDLPYFYIDSVAIDDTKNNTTIVAYDGIYKAKDKLINEVTFTYPTDLAGFATTVAAALGCELEQEFTTLNLANIDATNANFEGTETLQEVLTAIAEASGTFCYCNKRNIIKFKALSTTTAADTIEKGHYFNFKTETPITLTKVGLATQLGNNYISQGNEGFTQIIWDNPFIDLRAEDEIATILDTIAEKVAGMTMIPYELSWRGNPYYEPGDFFTVETKEGTQNIYYFNESLNYGGGLRATNSWKAAEEERIDGNPTSIGETIKQTYAKVDKVNKQIDMVVSEVGGYTESISQLQINTEKITASVQQIETNMNNELETVNQNIETIAQKVETSVSAEDVAIEVQKQMSDGVNSVTTTTGFTFNEDGLTVSKSDSSITTQITEDGMTVNRAGEAVLVADNVGVKATNLVANTYLIIGGRSRFEDYDLNGEPRTGCFWIGS